MGRPKFMDSSKIIFSAILTTGEKESRWTKIHNSFALSEGMMDSPLSRRQIKRGMVYWTLFHEIVRFHYGQTI